MTENLLINSIYPIEYFTLPGVDEIEFPDKSWWASKQRFASVLHGVNEDIYLPVLEGGVRTSEILEVDLGRIREVNYINFDILRAPIDIRLEYDAISSPDLPREWVGVRRHDELPFDDGTFYGADNRNGWFNAEMFFTDPKFNMVHTRYLRFVFTRRDDPWPTSNSNAFKWPIFVKHLRAGRFISEYRDTVGPLLNQDTPAEAVAVTLPDVSDGVTHEIRQRFVVPSSAQRGSIMPNMLGFGIMIKDSDDLGDIGDNDPDLFFPPVDIAWELWDVSNEAEYILIRRDAESHIINRGASWLDWYLDDKLIVPVDLLKVYELRVRSRNSMRCNEVYIASPNYLSSTPLTGLADFTSASATVNTTEDLTAQLQAGDWISQASDNTRVFQIDSLDDVSLTLTVPYPHASQSDEIINKIFPLSQWSVADEEFVQSATSNLVMRVWADVADEGRDILGNTYRYGVHRERAVDIFDGTSAGWMSDPKPTPDAVEALYFDVRGADPESNEKIFKQIDAVRIAPRTSGVRMNVYYSKENLQGEKPVTVEDWEYLLWTPVLQESYTLRRDEIIDLPYQIRAAFVKLEFTNLNPMPFRIPAFPPLPPKQFKRFPTWVENQFTNSELRNVIDDWYLRKSTVVEQRVLSELKDPILEFEHRQREFFTALAAGAIAESQIINTNLVDAKNRSVIDPTTGSKIFITGIEKYQNSLLISVDQDTILGKMIVSRYDPTLYVDPLEALPTNPTTPNIPLVSSVNNRVTGSYAYMAATPMRFNRTVRHAYREDQAEFNKKAYFVGIDEVQFLRQDFTVPHDDTVISDILYDNEMMVLNTWQNEQMSSLLANTTLYVSYQIGTGTEYYVDEEIVINGTVPVLLEGRGSPILNVFVHSLPGKQGVQYWQNDDWTISHGTDELGRKTHFISVSETGERLISPLQPLTFVDFAIVSGKGIIPSPPTDDEGVADGVGDVTGVEGPFDPEIYGAGSMGGGSYLDMTTDYEDDDAVSGDGDVSGPDEYIVEDEDTVDGVGDVTGVEVYEPA